MRAVGAHARHDWAAIDSDAVSGAPSHQEQEERLMHVFKTHVRLPAQEQDAHCQNMEDFLDWMGTDPHAPTPYQFMSQLMMEPEEGIDHNNFVQRYACAIDHAPFALQQALILLIRALKAEASPHPQLAQPGAMPVQHRPPRGQPFAPMQPHEPASSALESLPPEIFDLITDNLRGRDLLALSSANRGLSRRLAIPRFANRVAGGVYDIGQINAMLTSLSRDEPIGDTRGHYVRLTARETGRLLEWMALRVPSLDYDLDGYEDVGHIEQIALARFMLLDANDRLGKHGGDLSALRNGSQFASVVQAVYAGVPVPDAVRVLGNEGQSDDVLQRCAIPAARVLIRTGSTWKEAASRQGIDVTLIDCDDLKATAVASIICSAVRALDSRDEVRRLARAQGIDEPERIEYIEAYWTAHRNDAMTAAVLAGGPPDAIVDALSDTDDEDDAASRVEGQDLTEAECLRVLHDAPRLIEAGHSAQEVIASLGIRLPVSHQLAWRMHDGGVPSWLTVAKTESIGDDTDA
jgi:hypothetical protein